MKKHLDEYTVEELRAELVRRGDSIKYGCICHTDKRVPISRRVEGFRIQWGCLTCNRWDAAPVRS